MDIDDWVRHQSTIVELRAMVDAATAELARRSYFCAECQRAIPTALPLKHPAHDHGCSRYASMPIH